ncbi:hypothetical protein PI126_g15477 [Phytophthora idaei]|nr:hypothetical protein PI126_g15477 [Phytophthora idaei]
MALTRRASGRPGADPGASPYLHELRRRLSSFGSSQKTRRRLTTQPSGPATEKSSSICSSVQLALQEPLATVHLEVTDVSCARLQYRLLGTKRYWYRSVKQEKQGKIRWEVKMCQICCRKSTVEALLKCRWHTMPRLSSEDVAIKSVGFFDTEKAAMTALEAAVKSRDVTNPFSGSSVRKSELPLQLVKYFQVTIVSDKFQRKSQNERLEMIYRLLLDAAPNSANAQEDTETKPAYQQSGMLWLTVKSQLRGFSTIGNNVVTLSVWRSLECHFTVCAKTSTQWRAGRSRQEIERSFTERFGLSHLGNDRAFNVNQGMLPVSRGLAELISLNQEELSSTHKTESVPHFYHGLPDEVKRMIAEEQAKMAQGRADSTAFQKLTKNTEGTFVKKYLKRRREYVQVAIKLQQLYRSNMHRQELNYRRLTHHARYGKAALAVQAAWRSYCSRKQLKVFRFCSLIERKATSLTQSKEDREMIEFDIFDARADLKRVMKYKAKMLRRIKEMKEMRIEWERRQPVVEKELSQLTEEDMDRGWGEAFETEKHILRFSLELSLEDILSKKQQVREFEEEIEDLRIELEDLERDMEECVLNETMELESYRDMELQRARTMFAEEKARRIRLQRIRWGTRNVRKHVIMRERKDLELLQKEALAKRQVEELGVLAFEKKHFIKRKLEQAIEDAARSRAKQSEVRMEMKRDSNVLHGFNEAVQKMHGITQEYSFHYRLPKTDLREDPESAMCSGCGRITCDCHLKNNESADDNEEATKKLDTNNAMTNTRSRLAKRWRYQD